MFSDITHFIAEALTTHYWALVIIITQMVLVALKTMESHLYSENHDIPVFQNIS